MASSSENTMSNIPTQESGQSVGSRRREVKSRSSDIFKIHFHLIEVDNEGPRAVCNYCGVSYKFTGGYGNMTKHLDKHHAVELGIDTTQSQMGRFASSGRGTSSSDLFKYSDAKNREEFAKFTCMSHLSLSFGEKLAFTNYCRNALNPSACRMPRNTTKRHIFKLYKDGKIILNELFKDIKGRISICSDIWSDHWQTHSYMGVTAHWVDASWTMQKRLIAFRVFDESHTAHNIYRMIKVIFDEYGLTGKILTIGFDNASANTASIRELMEICQPNLGGRFFHIRCTCHVLNLCVQDGLEKLEPYILPIKIALNFIWSYSKIRREWAKFCKINSVRPIKFSRDVPTRWNSTYFLLCQAFEYKDVLCSFVSQHVQQITLLPSQWDICEQILSILKVFNDATLIFSGVYYPTTNLFLVTCLNIVGTLFEHSESTNPNDYVLYEAISAMKSKWLIYFKEIPLLYLIATVFDPRFKLEGLTSGLEQYYQYLRIEDEINVRRIIDGLRKDLVDLFNDYVTRYNLQTIGQSSSSETVQHSRLSVGDRWLLQRNRKQKESITNNPELDNYLSSNFEFAPESFVGKNFDVLDWWNRHQNVYPVLSIIAKELLSAPVSTVAVEQAFSMGGNILEARRSSLHPSTLEATACVDDWTRADLRQQEDAPDEFEDLFDNASSASGTAAEGSTGTDNDDD